MKRSVLALMCLCSFATQSGFAFTSTTQDTITITGTASAYAKSVITDNNQINVTLTNSGTTITITPNSFGSMMAHGRDGNRQSTNLSILMESASNNNCVLVLNEQIFSNGPNVVGVACDTMTYAGLTKTGDHAYQLALN